MEAKTKINNRLWQARQRAGLEQKQVAYLLGHKTCNQISRYERGDCLPNLQTALKLEIILRAPVREIFPDLYEQHRARIGELSSAIKLSPPIGDESRRFQTGAHICTYEILVLQNKPTENDIKLARQHSIKIVRELGDTINARKIGL